MKIKAAGLRVNDVIGVVAPAGTLFDRQALSKGLRLLNQMGFRTLVGKHVLAQCGYLAGSDAQRLEDLMTMFAHPDVRAILCLRGGYGTLRLLPYIDFDLIRRHPKVFIGYSDVTALHLAIQKCCRLVTFHGPMLATDFGGLCSPYTREKFLQLVLSGARPAVIRNPPDGPATITIFPGKARGELVGGNLTLITALMGTPFEIETRGRVLFIEEVGEPPYRLDRMLTQLRLAGKLTAAAGIVVGECRDCATAGQGSFTAMQVFRDCLGDLGIPCFYGLSAGHGPHKATLPLGVEVTMDADKHTLRLEEKAVHESVAAV
jgi:muramoyltetrapeptide carboxypeptidase